MRWSPPSAAICCRSGWHGCGGWHRRSARSDCRQPLRSRNCWRGSWCRSAMAKAEAADIVVAGGAAAPLVEMLDTRERLPWAGHSARHALAEVYELIQRNQTTLVFVNTRSQAEMLFQDLWRINDDGLADRAASRLARRRAAPQGRGCHDQGQTARRGLHLLARSRRRLGRCRSRHQCRRAERARHG